ncbi:hypothetical protein MLD38_034912 [Melastoma candidum]|uniref:Uncharacterized protein n=1 Tax=Melastoma candidum TaxID=119954 RepID=A0ACB9MDK7_9MYRT|nr:hypothetical protein MLD38_034912 [Melastoma candidum]
MPSDDANYVVAAATQQQQPRPPRTTAPQHHHNPNQAAAAESIPCPRCDSRSTKFCYYNNYNLSQPRHFCKSCRRYWTHGGTLRNVPVGGGNRKPATSAPIHSSSSSASSNKRPRCSPAVVSPCSSSSSSALSSHVDIGSSGGAPRAGSVCVNGDAAPSHGVVGGLGLGFSSLPSATGSNTFLALGGYVPTLDGMGFSFGRGVWPFPDAGLAEGAGYGSFRGPFLGPDGVDAWNVGGSVGNPARDGEVVSAGGVMDGESFPWPELAISMPGQGQK